MEWGYYKRRKELGWKNINIFLEPSYVEFLEKKLIELRQKEPRNWTLTSLTKKIVVDWINSEKEKEKQQPQEQSQQIQQ